MTIEEKLEHFSRFCLEDARQSAERILREHREDNEAVLEEYQREHTEAAELRVKKEREKIRKECNIRLSLAQLELRRKIGRKKEDLRERFFEMLEKKIAAFRNTEEYRSFLEEEIEASLRFASGEEALVYLDPSDQALLDGLRERCKAQIRLNGTSFGGGIRTMIPGRNILIDQSFEKKLSDAKEAFHFELLGEGNE